MTYHTSIQHIIHVYRWHSILTRSPETKAQIIQTIRIAGCISWLWYAHQAIYELLKCFPWRVAKNQPPTTIVYIWFEIYGRFCCDHNFTSSVRPSKIHVMHMHSILVHVHNVYHMHGTWCVKLHAPISPIRGTYVHQFHARAYLVWMMGGIVPPLWAAAVGCV